MQPGGKSVPAPSPSTCTRSEHNDGLQQRIDWQASRQYHWEVGLTTRMSWGCASMFAKMDHSLLDIMSSSTL